MSADRPTSFDTFIGQQHLIENLQVILGGAQFRGEAAPHMLFMGPAGLGKTSLANLIASEMGTTMVPALGTMLKKPADIAALLMSLSEGDILFIDEVHAMPRAVYETLYTAVEDFHLDVMVGAKPPRPVRLDLPHFTLVGATTHPGGISGPMRDRFGYVGKLSFYSTEELAHILYWKATQEDLVGINDEAAALLAGAGRGTPRVAIRIYERARDIAQSRRISHTIDVATAEMALKLCGVDHQGLDQTDQSVLQMLARAMEPVGLTTLASSLGEEESTIEDMAEPFLLRQGFITKTSRGRLITQKGLEHLHG